MSYQGRCLCGAVRYTIDGGIRNIVHCHCSRCRRAQGSAFATNGVVAIRYIYGPKENLPGTDLYIAQPS